MVKAKLGMRESKLASISLTIAEQKKNVTADWIRFKSLFTMFALDSDWSDICNGRIIG